MLAYLKEHDESKCCGCRACEQICPKHAIALVPNHEGFLYPVLTEALCVDCGLCEKVCPEMNRPQGDDIQAVYAIQHNQEAILKSSSSGGAFRAIADEMIQRGGYVVGCVWDAYYRPILRVAHSVDELLPMQGSKYLSSDTCSVYSEVKELLQIGKEVLFTGTPCQCAGLLTYLQKPYDKLLTADFLCHGVPSQYIFDSYLDSVEKKHGIKVETKTYEDGGLCPTHKQRGITSYKFRDKDLRGWGLVSTYTWTHGKKEKKHYAVGMTDPYDYGFLNGYFNRYSCYDCLFRGSKRFTDFTFCDYWGIESHHNIDSSKGASAITVNSQRAADFFESVRKNVTLSETTAESVARQNPSLVKKEIEEIPARRKTIYKDIRDMGWCKVERKQLRCKHRMIKKFWYAMPASITKKIKKVAGR